MLRALSLSLLAAFATVAISLPAEAARTKSSPKRGISYYSAPVTAVRSNRATNGRVARLSLEIPGIRDGSASPFGRQANGHAFFDRVQIYSSNQ